MSDYIPTDLVADILARLPVESLVRFTSVCKTWYSLITRPSFIKKHLNCSKTKAKNLLLKDYNLETRKERYLLCRGKTKLNDEFSELEPPLSTGHFGYKKILGSCNGLICIINFPLPSCIILWNPVIRISVTLPLPSGYQWYFLGFGVHPTTHEYILVSIVWSNNVDSTVELYTQGMGSWKPITSVGHPREIFHIPYSFCGQTVVNGAIHWIASERGLMGDYSSVILFNMVSQAFSVMVMPVALDSKPPLELSIMSYEESLGVLCHEIREPSCCIWVMKDYGVAESWAKVYNISLPRMSMSIIGFREENGDFLAILTTDSQLIWYDHETNTWTNAGYTGSSSSAFGAVNFMESLVLMERQNSVL